MEQWDRSQVHQQAWQTLGIIEDALAKRPIAECLDLEEARQWSLQLYQFLDELSFLAHEPRYIPRLRSKADFLHSLTTKELQRVKRLFAQLASEARKMVLSERAAQRQKGKATSPAPQKKTSNHATPKTLLSSDTARRLLQTIQRELTEAASVQTYEEAQARHITVLSHLDTLQTIRENTQLPGTFLSDAIRLKITLTNERAELKEKIQKFRVKRSQSANIQRTDGGITQTTAVEAADFQDQIPTISPLLHDAPSQQRAQPEIVRLAWDPLGETLPSFPMLRTHMRLFHAPVAGSGVQEDFERLEYLYSFSPTHIYIGRDEFRGYVVVYFAHYATAVFECPIVGNALFLVRGSWQLAARKSKHELLHDHSGVVRRIIHSGDWRMRVRQALEGNPKAIPE